MVSEKASWVEVAYRLHDTGGDSVEVADETQPQQKHGHR